MFREINRFKEQKCASKCYISSISDAEKDSENGENSSGGLPTSPLITAEAVNVLASLLQNVPQNVHLAQNGKPTGYTTGKAQKRDTLDVAETALLARDWFLDCESRNRSPRTVQLHTIITARLHWYCTHKCFQKCGPRELKQFSIYLQKGCEGQTGTDLTGRRGTHNPPISNQWRRKR